MGKILLGLLALTLLLVAFEAALARSPTFFAARCRWRC